VIIPTSDSAQCQCLVVAQHPVTGFNINGFSNVALRAESIEVGFCAVTEIGA